MCDSFASAQRIFGNAMELRSPGEREAHLAQACGDRRRW